MNVFISAAFSFVPAAADVTLTRENAAALQHPAIVALRGAFGWHDGTYNANDLIELLAEEGARIPAAGKWADYRRVSRAGSRFRLDRRTRGAVFVAVKTTRRLAL